MTSGLPSKLTVAGDCRYCPQLSLGGLERCIAKMLASLHWEVGNAISAMFRRRRITLEKAQQAIRSYEKIVFRFIDVDLGQSLELPDRLELYAYDAYVLACALTLRSPLITLDTKLSAAAPLVGVHVLELDQ